MLVGQAVQGLEARGVAVRLAVKGEVSALDDSITVNPRDGSPPRAARLEAGKPPSTEGVVPGTKVEIGCAVVDGKMTLLKLKKCHA